MKSIDFRLPSEEQLDQSRKAALTYLKKFNWNSDQERVLRACFATGYVIINSNNLATTFKMWMPGENELILATLIPPEQGERWTKKEIYFRAEKTIK